MKLEYVKDREREIRKKMIGRNFFGILSIMGV